jgi:hypothetical protein
MLDEGHSKSMAASSIRTVSLKAEEFLSQWHTALRTG